MTTSLSKSHSCSHKNCCVAYSNSEQCPLCAVEEALQSSNEKLQELDAVIEDLKGQLRHEAVMDANR